MRIRNLNYFMGMMRFLIREAILKDEDQKSELFYGDDEISDP